MKTIVGLFNDFDEARDVVDDLARAGFDRDEISLIARDHDGEYGSEMGVTDNVAEGAAVGAVTGSVVGGTAGLLLGIGALAIPGIGPVVAAGPLVATVTGAGIGAATGGLLGALVGWGIPEEEAEFYAEGVRRGGALVAVKAEAGQSGKAVAIMNNHNPVDVERRSQYWRESGWDGYDPDAEVFNREQYEAERDGYAAYNANTFFGFLPAFRNHYYSTYADSDLGFDYYAPGYRYGYKLANDDRYSHFDNWDRFEAKARQEWEEAEEYADHAWDDFKDSVRHAWEEVKDAFDGDE